MIASTCHAVVIRPLLLNPGVTLSLTCMIHRTSSALLRSLSHRVVSARHRPGQRAGCSGVLTNTQHSRATRLLPELPYFSSGYHSVSSATQTKPQRNWHCHVPAAASARVSSNVQGKVASGTADEQLKTSFAALIGHCSVIVRQM